MHLQIKAQTPRTGQSSEVGGFRSQWTERPTCKTSPLFARDELSESLVFIPNSLQKAIIALHISTQAAKTPNTTPQDSTAAALFLLGGFDLSGPLPRWLRPTSVPLKKCGEPGPPLQSQHARPEFTARSHVSSHVRGCCCRKPTAGAQPVLPSNQSWAPPVNLGESSAAMQKTNRLRPAMARYKSS